MIKLLCIFLFVPATFVLANDFNISPGLIAMAQKGPQESVKSDSVEEPLVETTRASVVEEPIVYFLEKRELELWIEDELISHYGLRGRLEVEALDRFDPVEFDWSEDEISIVSRLPYKLINRMLLKIEIINDGEKSTHLVDTKIENWVSVFVSKEQKGRGALIEMDEVTVIEIDALKEYRSYVGPPIDLSKYEVKTQLSANRPVQWNQVKLRPIVRKGQIVEAVASEGVLTVTMKAQALENGNLGDFIRLRNLQSSKEVQGQVVNEKLLKVYF